MQYSVEMDDFHCSFCGKRRREVRKLISGPRVFICDECVALCNDILAKEEAAERPRYPRPKEIYDELHKYVVGQDSAKKALAVAVYNHYKRIGQHGKNDVEIQKGNILLLGPTGCGKTLLVQTLARKLDVPFAIADATTLTEAGYVGEDVDSVIKACTGTRATTPTRPRAGSSASTRSTRSRARAAAPRSPGRLGRGRSAGAAEDPRGQAGLDHPGRRPQPAAAGADPGRHHRHPVRVHRRVQRAGGDRAASRRATAARLRRLDGKGEEDKNSLRSMSRTEDLIKYGMIPEFMGRLPIIVSADELDVDDLVNILWRPKNALVKQYEKLLAMEGVKLRFTEDALRSVAEEAARGSRGARGLRAILEEVMLDVMYEIPSLTGVSECVVTKDVVVSRGGRSW
jgi:ATP-dependent Clp protease ATP-binding subunit ClpX